MRGCIRVGLALEREMQLGRHLPLELGSVAGGGGRRFLLECCFLSVSLGEFLWRTRKTKARVSLININIVF